MIAVRMDKLQPLGRALMLPIAVLPIAGLLLRLGQPDLLEHRRSSPRRAMRFSRILGLLFAIGVAVGLARENHGAAGLAGAVCFLVLTEGAKALLIIPPDAAAAFTDSAARDLANRRMENQAARQAQRSGRNPVRRCRGDALQPVQRHQAAGLSRLLRRAAFRSDRRRRGRAWSAR